MRAFSIIAFISTIPSIYFFQPVRNEWENQKSILDKIITPCAVNQTCGSYYVSSGTCHAPDNSDGVIDCTHGILAICKVVCDVLSDLDRYKNLILGSLLLGSVGLIFLIGFLRYYCFTPKNELDDTPIKNFYWGRTEAAYDMFSAFDHTSFFRTQSFNPSMKTVRAAAIRAKLKLFDFPAPMNEPQEKLLIQCKK